MATDIKIPEPTTKPYWGPQNPHPLSTLRTELVWEGKYDEYGNRREIDLTGCAMPLQKIETIDQPLSQAQATGQLQLFQKTNKRLDDFRNMLIWGDNKLVIASLLANFRGSLDLIYIDPPFDVGADFTMNISIGDDGDPIDKDQSAIEMVAYRDTWGRGTDSYLHMMAERLHLMKELLNDNGSIYVHCDYRVSHFLREILDELFVFQNEIIWCYNVGGKGSSRWARKHDTILFFTKTTDFYFDGKAAGVTRDTGTKSTGGIIRKDENGRLYQDKLVKATGKYYRYYLDEPKIPEDWWTDINSIQSGSTERVDYATQKPEALLERIIKASSPEGGMVADLFCGSGTTPAIAERLGRRWIAADLGRFAIHTTRKRIIEIQRDLNADDHPYRSFDLYNLGRYERQWWQKERLKGADDEHRNIILTFYKAEPLSKSPSPLLQGRKGQAFVHVDSIDSLLTREELTSVAEACHNCGGKELHCLAWEFEMDLKLIANSLEKQYGITIKLITIPREIMEKNRKEPPPFLEVAELEAKPIINSKNKTVELKLTRFFPSLAEISTKELETLKERAIKNGFDFIDFWAVDFDYDFSSPFNHDWQAYRTRKDRALPLETNAAYKYDKPGKHTICVKVIDVFGADTTITLEVDI